MASQRKQYTAEFKQQAIAFAHEQKSYAAAGKKFNINGSMVARWNSEQEGKTNKTHRKTYQRRSPAERNHFDTISFLKRAWKCHVSDVRNGKDLSMAAIYTKLALDSLTGESE